MGVRYPRPTTYLHEISNMQVIDLLFDTMRSTRTSDVIPRGLSPSRPPTSAAMQAVNNMPPHHLSSSQNSLVYPGRGMTSINARLPPPPSQGIYGEAASRMPASGMIRLQIPARDGLPASTASLRMTTQRLVTVIQKQPFDNYYSYHLLVWWVHYVLLSLTSKFKFSVEVIYVGLPSVYGKLNNNYGYSSFHWAKWSLSNIKNVLTSTVSLLITSLWLNEPCICRQEGE
jgi:hypothetical protein